MKIKINARSGFTLGEIMIVVAIIGLLAAIAIPNFVRARESAQLNSIANNLRLLESAKEQWALENKKNSGDPVTTTVLLPFLKGATLTPVAGEVYSSGTVSDPIVATISTALAGKPAGPLTTTSF